MLLFVREPKVTELGTAPYLFLGTGPVRRATPATAHRDHVVRLRTPMPADQFTAASVVA